MLKNIFFSCLASFALLACHSTQIIPSKAQVKPVSEVNDATVNSLMYYLPKTVLRIEVDLEKTISKVGPFYRYSKKLLNVSEVITEDKQEWKIADIRLSSYGVVDESQHYMISYSGHNVAPLVHLNSQGLLAGINLSDEMNCSPALKEITTQETPNLEDVNFDDVPLLEKQLTKTSTTAMADDAAAFIYKIRKRRFKIISSKYKETPPDGQSYQTVLEELNTLEKQYLELFVGKKETYKTTKVLFLEPGIGSGNTDVLFRFSSLNGMVDKMDLSGTPVYIEWEQERQRPLPNTKPQKVKVEPKYGLYYRLPGKMMVKIIDRNILLKEQEVEVAQFGQVVSLPPDLLEQDDIEIKFHPETGALKSIKRK